MREPAVADSTCLIGLECAGWLHLLPSLFELLVVPPKVQEEFGAYYDWLMVQVPLNQSAVEAARASLTMGKQKPSPWHKRKDGG